MIESTEQFMEDVSAVELSPPSPSSSNSCLSYMCHMAMQQ